MKQYTTVNKLKEEERLKNRKKTKIIISIFIGFVIIVIIFGIKNIALYEGSDSVDYNDTQIDNDMSNDGEDDVDLFDSFGPFMWLIPAMMLGLFWLFEALFNRHSLFRRMFR